MRKIALLFLILALFLIVVLPAHAFAQEANHTAREEQEGKEIWEKLQAKQLKCKNLTDNQYYGALGDALWVKWREVRMKQ